MGDALALDDESLFTPHALRLLRRDERVSHNEVTRTLMTLGAVVDLPPWREVLRRDPCSYCGSREDKDGVVHGSPMTMDHIVPRSITGESRSYPVRSNAAPACRPCNQAKGSQPLLVFLVGGAMRSSLVPAGPATVRDAFEALGGGLQHARQLAAAMRVDPYVVGMELAAMRADGAVERLGKRWRLVP